MSMDRYEEAMSRCKQWEREHTKGYVIQDMIEFIFPELANEDEKIKRAISYAIAQVKHEDGILIDRITEDMALAWLEKQKEQKPAEWSQKDFNIRNNLADYLTGELKLTEKAKLDGANWLKSLRPQPHWKPSEEQMYALKDAIETYRVRHNVSTSGDNIFKGLESLYADLKKLH